MRLILSQIDFRRILSREEKSQTRKKGRNRDERVKKRERIKAENYKGGRYEANIKKIKVANQSKPKQRFCVYIYIGLLGFLKARD